MTETHLATSNAHSQSMAISPVEFPVQHDRKQRTGNIFLNPAKARKFIQIQINKFRWK